MEATEEATEEATAGTRVCPFCAEEIRPAALRCKHCRADLARRPARRALFVAAAVGLLASILPALLDAATAPAGAGHPIPAALDACPADAGARLPPGHPPLPGMGGGAGRLPAWHPPLERSPGVDFPQDGTRTL